MRKTGLAGAALAVALTAAFVPDAAARSGRVTQIPHGALFGCSSCHVSAAGGGTLTSFGSMIYSGFLTDTSFMGSVVWGPELAALDADGDGATNGAELQDPEGLWRSGSPSPGDADAVTEPWNADSSPPEPTAVAASSWARVKAVLALPVAE